MREANDDWTVIARSLDPTEAHLWCACLQAARIDAMVADANLVQAHSLIGVAVGGVRVMVPASQLAEAKEVLAAFHRGDFSLDADETGGEPEA